MQIDWKTVSKSPGYLSLKRCVANDLRKRHRSKKELLTLFNWVICRAKHYAHVLQKPIEEVLNEWESKRDYWWLSYYSDSRQPKLNPSPLVRPRAAKSYYKSNHYSPKLRKELKCEAIMRAQDVASKRKGKKSRWTAERKRRNK